MRFAAGSLAERWRAGRPVSSSASSPARFPQCPSAAEQAFLNAMTAGREADTPRVRLGWRLRALLQPGEKSLRLPVIQGFDVDRPGQLDHKMDDRPTGCAVSGSLRLDPGCNGRKRVESLLIGHGAVRQRGGRRDLTHFPQSPSANSGSALCHRPRPCRVFPCAENRGDRAGKALGLRLQPFVRAVIRAFDNSNNGPADLRGFSRIGTALTGNLRLRGRDKRPPPAPAPEPRGRP